MDKILFERKEDIECTHYKKYLIVLYRGREQLSEGMYGKCFFHLIQFNDLDDIEFFEVENEEFFQMIKKFKYSKENLINYKCPWAFLIKEEA